MSVSPLTEEQRNLLSEYATTSLRNQADRDYIAARFCYRAEFFPQFLWQSLQTIEKYLKATLLFSCQPAKYRHDAAKALQAAKNLPHIQLRIPPQAEEFVQFVTDYGTNRYLDRPVFLDDDSLGLLDWTVWHIRRFCQDFLIMPGDSDRYDPIHSQISLRLAHEADVRIPTNFRLSDGLLEKILDNGSRQARAALVYKNLYFGRSHRRRIKDYGIISYVENPTHVMNPELLPLLERLVFIPDDVLAELKTP